jgi:hypothetical protein
LLPLRLAEARHAMLATRFIDWVRGVCDEIRRPAMDSDGQIVP